MIMASQFKSIRLPFVMLFTIPVSLVGIVLALLAAGQGFSITALMGILMVIGIAVSNGILLVDDANRRYNEEGADKVAAIVAAARTRFVPIAMTSLASVIGLIPTAFGLERGSEANQPLALAVVCGLTSSTFLSLFLVPVMFLFLARRSAEATAPHLSGPLEEAHPCRTWPPRLRRRRTPGMACTAPSWCRWIAPRSRGTSIPPPSTWPGCLVAGFISFTSWTWRLRYRRRLMWCSTAWKAS